MATPGTRTRIEQAIAYGRTLDWICDNLHVEASLVDDVLRRMDAAARVDDHADVPPPPPLFTYQGRPLSSYFGPTDPSTIRELIDVLVPRERERADRDETVLRLAGEGLTDKDIAALVGMTRQGVSSLRRRLARAA